ncbi:hypothetical protein H0Z60_20460 [Ectothiorhodospiraceae bacterium WFHF3C12]|nr:hypothetical protein [Ectothiorhodospiraceae bacterium WFHF3C12]
MRAGGLLTLAAAVALPPALILAVFLSPLGESALKAPAGAEFYALNPRDDEPMESLRAIGRAGASVQSVIWNSRLYRVQSMSEAAPLRLREAGWLVVGPFAASTAGCFGPVEPAPSRPAGAAPEPER